MDAQLVAEVATGAGTLVLATATFASVRSARRSTLIAERQMLTGIRPLLLPSKLSDEKQKVGFVDNHYVIVEGSHGAAEEHDAAVYMAMSVRNAGSGLALLRGWSVVRQPGSGPDGARGQRPPAAEADFRRLTRDLYVPGGDIGFWQGAVRDEEDPDYDFLRTCIKDKERIVIDVLYGDQEGDQHTVSRFSLQPHDVDGQTTWLVIDSRHFFQDRSDPR